MLLALACLLPFIGLGVGEIQPWDESLYVIRAQACLTFGAWLDQTQYAVGHLYSATHPPLGVWLIAISKYLFGDSTFAIRLPVALAASASVFLLWSIIRKFASSEAALIAAISLSTADLFLELSHRAQMESLILFFSLAAIYLLMVSMERDRWMFALFSGILFGFGLLTKFGETLFIIPFIFLLPWAMGKPRAVRFTGISIAIAIVMSAPWFAMMALRHPDYWNHVYGSLETLREGNYAPSTLAWWYYLNRLLVGLPLILIALFSRGSRRWFRASLVWLGTLLLVLQLVGTRMPHFAFLMLAPGTLLIGSSWDAVVETRSKKFMGIVIALLAIAWSASVQVRLFLTHRLAWNGIEIPSVGIVTIIVSCILATVFWWFLGKRPVIIFSTILLGLALAHLFSDDQSESMQGAPQAATMLLSGSAKNNLIVIHRNFPNEEYAPQLAYYTKGWTLGWIPGKTSRAITWDSAVTNSYITDSSRECAVVVRFEDRFYHRPASEPALWDSLTCKLQKSFTHEQIFGSYILYY